MLRTPVCKAMLLKGIIYSNCGCKLKVPLNNRNSLHQVIRGRNEKQLGTITERQENIRCWEVKGSKTKRTGKMFLQRIGWPCMGLLEQSTMWHWEHDSPKHFSGLQRQIKPYFEKAVAVVQLIGKFSNTKSSAEWVCQHGGGVFRRNDCR